MLIQMKSNGKQGTSLYAMQFIFAGLLAFELLDRITGEWSVVHGLGANVHRQPIHE